MGNEDKKNQERMSELVGEKGLETEEEKRMVCCGIIVRKG